MDFLNRAFAQLNDLFRSMTPGARLTAGLLLVVIVVSLGWMFQHRASTGDVDLLAGRSFTADEIARMEAAFGSAGLGDFTIDGSHVRVPRAKKAAYLAALVEGNAMPVQFGDYLMDAANNTNPLVTGPQFEEQNKVAKQMTLANVIRNMKGIESAQVIYDSRRRGGFSPRSSREATASVMVKTEGDLPLSDEQALAIRRFVASAVGPDLPPENVTVTDALGIVYNNLDASTPDGAANSYLSLMQKYRRVYEESVRAALSYVEGVTVSASVELTTDQVHQTERVDVDPTKLAAIRSVEQINTENSQAPAPAGRPGLESQQSNAPARVAATVGPSSEISNSTTELQNAVTHGHTKIAKTPYTPTRVTMAIGVPESYFVKVWRSRNPAPAGEEQAAPDADALLAIRQEETEKIQTHVATLIPSFDPTVDPRTLVKVTTFSQLPQREIPSPSPAETAFGWLAANWSTVGMLGLVITTMLMLRSMIRSDIGQDADEPVLPPVIAPFTPPVVSQSMSEPDEEKMGSKRRFEAGSNLREDLVDMVREDPDGAANILRGWIGSAS